MFISGARMAPAFPSPHDLHAPFKAPLEASLQVATWLYTEGTTGTGCRIMLVEAPLQDQLKNTWPRPLAQLPHPLRLFVRAAARAHIE